MDYQIVNFLYIIRVFYEHAKKNVINRFEKKIKIHIENLL
jgi:hypothetical protein